MSRRNRNERRTRRQALDARAAAAVQTPAHEVSAEQIEGLRQLAELVPVDPPRPPRPFGEPRVFRLDGGYKVTIEGDADAVEQEFSVSAENDQLHVFTADAAIDRRIAKQQGSTAGWENRGHFMTSQGSYAPQRSLSPAAPPGVGDPVRVPGVPYDGTGPRPRNADMQEKLLADVGMSADALVESLGINPQQLRAVEEEEIA